DSRSGGSVPAAPAPRRPPAGPVDRVAAAWRLSALPFAPVGATRSDRTERWRCPVRLFAGAAADLVAVGVGYRRMAAKAGRRRAAAAAPIEHLRPRTAGRIADIAAGTAADTAAVDT